MAGQWTSEFTYESSTDCGTGQSGFWSDKTDVTFDEVILHDGTSRDPEIPRIRGLARFSVVDVPWHERFVGTVVAGATGIDLALLVVTADDSVMPQTIEHVEILGVVGVDRCAVAITKCDLGDEGLGALGSFV